LKKPVNEVSLRFGARRNRLPVVIASDHAQGVGAWQSVTAQQLILTQIASSLRFLATTALVSGVRTRAFSTGPQGAIFRPESLHKSSAATMNDDSCLNNGCDLRGRSTVT
jgi:tellurite resistance-related uncharacterized protein